MAAKVLKARHELPASLQADDVGHEISMLLMVSECEHCIKLIHSAKPLDPSEPLVLLFDYCSTSLEEMMIKVCYSRRTPVYA